MPYSPAEVFAPNRHINTDIHAILKKFSEPSVSRMVKQIRHYRDAAISQNTAKTDENARHIFREFLVGERLNDNGFHLEYGTELPNRQTPDWLDLTSRLLIECFTCERSGKPRHEDRIAEAIRAKSVKYQNAVDAHSLFFVVAFHPDVGIFFDWDDFEDATKEWIFLFKDYPVLSGVICFMEVSSIKPSQKLPTSDGYGFKYFANPHAIRPLNLADKLLPKD